MKLPGFKIILNTVLLLPAVHGADNPPPPSPSPAPTAPQPAASAYSLAAYAAIGSSLAEAFHLQELGWSETQISAFIEGLRAGLHGKKYAFDAEAQRLQSEIGQRLAKIEKQGKPPAPSPADLARQCAQRLKELRQRHHLQETDSGLCFSVQSGRNGAASGVRPGPDDTVIISYAAIAPDGTTKLPQLAADGFRVKMTDLLPGFTEGLQMMTVDSRALLVMPPALAFGEGDWPPGLDRGMPLMCFVTLHEVISAEASR